VRVCEPEEPQQPTYCPGDGQTVQDNLSTSRVMALTRTGPVPYRSPYLCNIRGCRPTLALGRPLPDVPVAPPQHAGTLVEVLEWYVHARFLSEQFEMD
jgi:hypothetical protein